jgi:hypothetical protein
MLQNKKIIFKYKTILKLFSFNKSCLNKSIWNLRNFLKYTFFLVLKKTYFLFFIFYYKSILFFLYNKFKFFFNIFFKYYSFLFFNFSVCYQDYIFNFLNLKDKDLKIIFKINKFNTNIIILNINNFYINYKNYIFYIYIWLYSIKVFNFFHFNASHLPTQKRYFVLLRSPHKDKKSREKFKMKKLKKNILLPSFSYSKFFFNFFSTDSILLKCDTHINKS